MENIINTLKKLIPLETVLNFYDYFNGDCFYTTINEKEYSFIKWYLGQDPKLINHPLNSFRINQPACYFIRHFDTGQIYVGSTNEIYNRIIIHKTNIRLKKSQNSKFANLLKESNISDFTLFIFFTENREEAFELEQYFVDKWKNSDKLLNVSHDVRNVMKNQSYNLSKEQSLKRGKSLKGLIKTEEHRKKISITKQKDKINNIRLAEQNKLRYRPISVNGVVYESISHAATSLGTSKGALTAKASKENSGVFFPTKSKNKYVGIPLSEEHRRKLSESRKNSLIAKQATITTGLLARKKIFVNGVLYDSIKEAAKHTDLCQNSLWRLANRSDNPPINGIYSVNHVKHRRRPKCILNKL